MFVRPASERPMVLSVGFLDWQVVDTCNPPGHEPIRIEFPIFVSVRSEPVSAVIVKLVSEAHGDPVITESPYFFDKPIIQFLSPLPLEKLNDLLSSGHELGAVPPNAVDCISKSYLFGVAAVPAVFGEPDFLNRRLQCKRG